MSQVYTNSEIIRELDGEVFITKYTIELNKDSTCFYLIENYVISEEGDTLSNEGEGRLIYNGKYIKQQEMYILELELAESIFILVKEKTINLRLNFFDEVLVDQNDRKYQASPVNRSDD